MNDAFGYKTHYYNTFTVGDYFFIYFRNGKTKHRVQESNRYDHQVAHDDNKELRI